MLRTETVAEPTLALLKQLMALPELAPFSLVGGTNLALRLGHRISVDIDLFTTASFDLVEIKEAVANAFPDAIELSARNQDLQQDPIDLLKVTWPEVKATLRNHIRNYTSSILG